MTPERAIEILNPKHREHYDSIETVNEACRMGMKALEKQIPKKPIVKTERTQGKYYICPRCNAFIRLKKDPFMRKYCSNCGQALDWSDEE